MKTNFQVLLQINLISVQNSDENKLVILVKFSLAEQSDAERRILQQQQ